MLQLENSTPFPAGLHVLANRDGIDTVHAVVKGTFTLEPVMRIADDQVPLIAAPEYHGDPETASIKRPSDVSLDKPGTDVVMLGHAHAPNDRPVAVLDVSVTVGALQKTVRVFGDRVWESNGAGYSASSPVPFVMLPLVWERAFGGKDQVEAGVREESRNPVGTGYRVRGGQLPVEGTHLPNLEDPYATISSWSDTPMPAGFAPVAPHWEPRRSYAGTYDDAWQQSRAPFLPADFDDRFLLIAPPGFASNDWLRGNESVVLDGVSPDGTLRSTLPGLHPRVRFHLDGQPNERPARLDTIVIEPQERRVSLVWRASFACDKKVLRVDRVVVSLERS